MAMTLQQVTKGLTHFRKKHGSLTVHIIPTQNGVAVVSIAQNTFTPQMDIIQDKSAEAMTRYALLTLHNPPKKMIVDNSNASDLLKITLLKDVVIKGAIL